MFIPFIQFYIDYYVCINLLRTEVLGKAFISEGSPKGGKFSGNKHPYCETIAIEEVVLVELTGVWHQRKTVV